MTMSPLEQMAATVRDNLVPTVSKQNPWAKTTEESRRTYIEAMRDTFLQMAGTSFADLERLAIICERMYPHLVPNNGEPFQEHEMELVLEFRAAWEQFNRNHTLWPQSVRAEQSPVLPKLRAVAKAAKGSP